MKYFRSTIAIIIGACLQSNFITSPVHELGHLLYLGTIGVHGTYEWRAVSYSAFLNHHQLFLMGWSGIFTEFTFFLILYVILMKLNRFFFAKVCLGVSISAYLTASIYTDVININGEGVAMWYILSGIVLAYAIYVTHATKKKKSTNIYTKTRYHSPIV